MSYLFFSCWNPPALFISHYFKFEFSLSAGNLGRRKAEYWWLTSESPSALLTLGLSKSKQELRFVWGSGPLLKETAHGDRETNFVCYPYCHFYFIIYPGGICQLGISMSVG